jgi:hypothetical protein
LTKLFFFGRGDLDSSTGCGLQEDLFESPVVSALNLRRTRQITTQISFARLLLMSQMENAISLTAILRNGGGRLSRGAEEESCKKEDNATNHSDDRFLGMSQRSVTGIKPLGSGDHLASESDQDALIGMKIFWSHVAVDLALS